ncbi:MAG: S24/S26 family peptidase [Bacilli bacterium]
MEKETNTQTKEKKKLGKKEIISNIINILEIILIVFAFFVIIASISNKTGGVSRLPVIDVSFLAIQTDSMEPTIKVGDLTIMGAYDESKELVAGYKDSDTPGDIVAIWVGAGRDKYLRIHRLVEMREDPHLIDSETGKPLVWCTTKGDNEFLEDDPFLTNDIVAVYRGKIGGLGKVLDWIKDPTVFLVAVFLPMLGLFVWNLFAFIKFFVDLKRKTELAKAAETGELSDELKELAIQEFLKKQKEELAAKEKAKEEEKESSKEEKKE